MTTMSKWSVLGTAPSGLVQLCGHGSAVERQQQLLRAPWDCHWVLPLGSDLPMMCPRDLAAVDTGGWLMAVLMAAHSKWVVQVAGVAISVLASGTTRGLCLYPEVLGAGLCTHVKHGAVAAVGVVVVAVAGVVAVVVVVEATTPGEGKMQAPSTCWDGRGQVLALGVEGWTEAVEDIVEDMVEDIMVRQE
jgi:hypothetical protein